MSTRSGDIALIGLAVMGQNLILNMNDHGFTVVAYNRTTDKVDAFLKSLTVVDADRSAAFFSRVLGFETVSDIEVVGEAGPATRGAEEQRGDVRAGGTLGGDRMGDVESRWHAPRRLPHHGRQQGRQDRDDRPQVDGQHQVTPGPHAAVRRQ